MQSLEKIKSTLSNHKQELSENYKIKEIGVFGSYVKGNQKKHSDVDILVEFEARADLGLLDFIGLENHLSELLGTKVDLVEKQTLKPRIGKHVLDEVVRIWQKSTWIIEDIVRAMDDSLSFVKEMRYDIFVFCRVS